MHALTRGSRRISGELSTPCLCVCPGLRVFWVCGSVFVEERSKIGDLNLSHYLCVYSDCVRALVCIWCSRSLPGTVCLRLPLERLLWLRVLCGLTEGTAVWQATDVWMIEEDTVSSLSVCVHAREWVWQKSLRVFFFIILRENRDLSHKILCSWKCFSKFIDYFQQMSVVPLLKMLLY